MILLIKRCPYFPSGPNRCKQCYIRYAEPNFNILEPIVSNKCEPACIISTFVIMLGNESYFGKVLIQPKQYSFIKRSLSNDLYIL